MNVAVQHVLSETIASKASVAHLAAWYAAATPTPTALTTAMKPDFAAALAKAMDALPHWEHATSLIDDDGTVRRVDLARWLNTPEERRWSSQRIAQARPVLLQGVE